MCRNRWRLHGRWFGVLLFLFLSATVLFAEAPPSNRLTLDQAIDLALRFHPTLRTARATTQVQEARLGEARSDFYPKVDLTADYRRSTANFAPSSQTGSSLNRLAGLGTSNSSFDNYSSVLSLQQRIFDFGKTGATVESAREEVQASRWTEEATREDVVVNVKVAYFALLGTRYLVRVNEETVQQFEQHLEQAQGFFSIGTRPKFDVTKAEVDLTNARLNLIRAKNNAEVARVTLANAIGLPNQSIGELEDILNFKKFEVTEKEALEEAMSQRPELRSILATKRAAEASVRATQRAFFPVLSGTADYTYRGQDFPLIWNWDVGLNLTFPIFSGFLQKSQVAEARANLGTVFGNEELLRQNIFLEVRQTYLNLLEAEERVLTSNIVVRQAEENLELANGRFQAGVGTSVERTDAQVLLTNAKTTQIQSLYDYKVAVAHLEKAMGRP
ncbi:MAG: TolC family protein [Nitrospirae bacterium]|nr:TolC family protein [Candidatus Manganitrophaceae bacterium]